MHVDEIVVCDDGSTDGTVQILKEYEQQFPNLFKISINEKNLQSVKNFEKAIEICRGEIIFLSDQDDVWMPNKVQAMLTYFETHPKINVLASNGFGIDEKSNELKVYSLWDIPQFFVERNIKVVYYKIFSSIRNIATGASMALRRNFLPQITPFPEIKGFHHDAWIALVAATQNSFDLLPQKLFKYRIHENQQVGDVFFEKTEKSKKLLIQEFDYSVSDQRFGSYKNVLKRISKSYKQNQLLGAHKDHQKISNLVKKDLEEMFYKHQREVKKKYPIRYFFLKIYDVILKKRRLS